MSELTNDNTAARMFYQKMTDPDTDFSDDRELVPSPNINMSIETFYANESIIGYTYNITLTGYAASKQDRDQFHDDTIGYVVGSIAKLQNIFDVVGNGGKLVIKTPGQNTPLMVFKGGRLKRMDFSPSNNQWVRYSEYTIELEFNDAELFGCNYSANKECTSTLFDGGSNISGIAGDLTSIQRQLVDHSKFKLKSFNDNWNISLQDEIYDWGKIDNTLEVNNKRYTVEYTISAVGQHYWDDNGNLFPAWKQAKAFCQDRLVKQVNAFYTNMAMHYSGPELAPCESSEDITEIHSVVSPSIHITIGAMNIFEEKITFGVGESEGSFNVTYSAIVKKAVSTCITSPDTIHNISITRGGSNTCTTSNRTVTISGSIQGLIRWGQGSIIWPNAEGFRIPDTPGEIVFLPPKQDLKHRWNRANDLRIKFLDECTGAITCGPLWDIVKKCLTPPTDENEPCAEICPPDKLKPANFNITNNYNAGTIDYSVEYNYDKKDNNRKRCSINISTEEPVPLTAEFTIPGKGIYYQPLGGCTPKKWTINAEGIIDGYNTDMSCDELATYVSTCSNTPIGCGTLITPGNGYLLVSKQKTFNPMDGSFSYNATYVCTTCPDVECS